MSVSYSLNRFSISFHSISLNTITFTTTFCDMLLSMAVLYFFGKLFDDKYSALVSVDLMKVKLPIAQSDDATMNTGRHFKWFSHTKKSSF